MSRPIVFIPGILGSKLTLDGEPLWTNRRTAISTLRSRPLDLLEPRVEAPGIFEEFTAPRRVFGRDVFLGFSGKPAPVYKPGMDALRATGRPVYAFPYNWVGSITDSARKLDTWLEEKSRAHLGEAWTIVAHSMGGLVTWAFLELRRQSDIEIERIVLVGSPLRGSLRAVMARAGFDEELDRFLKPLWAHLSLQESDLDNLRLLLSRMPSLYQLQPEENEDIAYNSEMKLHSLAEFPNLLMPSVRERWLEESPRLAAEAEGLPSPGGDTLVPKLDGGTGLTLVYCGDLETPWRVKFGTGGYPDRFYYDAGDRVVRAESARPRLDCGENVVNSYHVCAEHSHLPTSEEFAGWIRSNLRP